MKKILSIKNYVALILLTLLISCSAKNQQQIVLWTDCVEFISYAELYNSLQSEVKIIALYKDAVETTIPIQHGEQAPDIIAGSFLQSGIAKKQFANLNSLFGKNKLSKEIFYPALLQVGAFEEKQFLLPVSFNLPAMVFHTSNYDYAQSKFLSFDTLKNISKNFNAQNKDGVYTSMGFAPHWNTEFLYLVLKTAGVTYTTENGKLNYSEYAFNSALDSINAWSNEANGGVQNEQDFSFKYLYMPFYNQVQNGRCLFSYATSNQIISLSENQLENIDFRWICNDNKIQIEDDAVMAGIYSASKNKSAAKKFLLWFFNEDSQKKMLERKIAMKLRTSTFGIAGGFSSIQSVNEKLYPLYYRPLLSNLPVAEYLSVGQTFPPDWEEIKAKVVLPFILASTENSGAKIKPLPERYSEFLSIKEANQR